MLFVLMRHSEAAEPLGTPDHERPLTARGERDAVAMGRWLRENVRGISLVKCSTAVRAVRTCELVCGELVELPEPIYAKDLYRADAEDLLEAARAGDADDVLMVIAHNPAVAQAADVLAQEPLHTFPAGAVAVFEVAPTTSRLVAFAAP